MVVQLVVDEWNPKPRKRYKVWPTLARSGLPGKQLRVAPDARGVYRWRPPRRSMAAVAAPIPNSRVRTLVTVLPQT